MFQQEAWSGTASISVNECARKGYNLRFTCGGCGRQVEANAVVLMQELHGQGATLSLMKLEHRAKCRECGHRGATVMPCDMNF